MGTDNKKTGKRGIKISYNAPAILSFVIACVTVEIISFISGGRSNNALFSVYRSSLANPLTYIRCFTHVLGHGSWDHLLGNMMYILILGPMIEEKYGTKRVILVMLATALVTGVVNMLFFPSTRLLGASGIVFAFILLSSITLTKEDAIPLTFILVAALYIGQQIYQAVAVKDTTSQLTHILGGVVGSCLGFIMNRTDKLQR